MSEPLVVHKNRTNIIPVRVLGLDLSGETITSQIRAEPEQDAELIATWDVDFVTDGSDGELVLTLPHAVAGAIVHDFGYMDIKRVAGQALLPLFDRPLEVLFRGTVTT